MIGMDPIFRSVYEGNMCKLFVTFILVIFLSHQQLVQMQQAFIIRVCPKLGKSFAISFQYIKNKGDALYEASLTNLKF